MASELRTELSGNQTWLGRAWEMARYMTGRSVVRLAPKVALARYAATGCVDGVFDARVERQWQEAFQLGKAAGAEFTAKAAVYSRRRSKNVSAMLCAVLARLEAKACKRVFPRVCRDEESVMEFATWARVGVRGRKAGVATARKLIAEWLASQPPGRLLRLSAAESGALGDVMNWVQPVGATRERELLYSWLAGDVIGAGVLREDTVRSEGVGLRRISETAGATLATSDSIDLARGEWRAWVRRVSWGGLYRHLNGLVKYGAMQDSEWMRVAAERLADEASVRASGVLPYALMVSRASTAGGLPQQILEAMDAALEFSTANVSPLPGGIVVCPDVSGSMGKPWLGSQAKVAGVFRFVDVAALVTATIVRGNPSAQVLPFSWEVMEEWSRRRNSVAATTHGLARILGGGTDCSAPLRRLNESGWMGDLVILISDDQCGLLAESSAMREEWEALKGRNPGARLVCIELQPGDGAPAMNAPDVLTVRGFSDGVFEQMTLFASGGGVWTDPVNEIEQVEL